jgi:hypothetical protein
MKHFIIFIVLVTIRIPYIGELVFPKNATHMILEPWTPKYKCPITKIKNYGVH